MSVVLFQGHRLPRVSDVDQWLSKVPDLASKLAQVYLATGDDDRRQRSAGCAEQPWC